jgi:hypothetical protein
MVPEAVVATLTGAIVAALEGFVLETKAGAHPLRIKAISNKAGNHNLWMGLPGRNMIHLLIKTFIDTIYQLFIT